MKLKEIITLGTILLSTAIPIKSNATDLILNNSTSQKLEKIIQTKEITPIEFQKLPTPTYTNVTHEDIQWENIGEGLEFARIEIYRKGELVDVIAATKIDPEKNSIKVFNGYDPKGSLVDNIEEWQKHTGASIMINSAQYMADPYYKPCALIISDGIQKGPKKNKVVTGMLVSEPTKEGLPKADLLDFNYNKKFDYKNPTYKEGVMHWAILLDKNEKIRVKNTQWQANRTVVAKNKDQDIIFMTTEGGFFTLYNFGRFLKDSNRRDDKGFNIHTAMNMDGGYEANMIVRTDKLSYLTYGEFETYGPNQDVTIHNIKIEIPGVIGVFPRK